MPFKKAKCEQKYLKIAIYGSQGSGKTCTSLLFAEGLAELENKRIAYIDTEHGTDFYAQDVEARTFHKKKFDFDRIITRSLSESIKEVNALDCNEYGVLVVDSITHLWEAAILSYEGRKTMAGTVPIHAWGAIKKPYKNFITTLMNLNCHVIICGREGNVFEDIDGEMKMVGKKMKAEIETAYEPHFLINMQQRRYDDSKTNTEKGDIVAYFEKARGFPTGISEKNPTFKMIEPIVELIKKDSTHGKISSIDEIEEKESDVLDNMEKEKQQKSKNARMEMADILLKCKDIESLKKSWDKNKDLLKKMNANDKKEIESIKEQQKTLVIGN